MNRLTALQALARIEETGKRYAESNQLNSGISLLEHTNRMVAYREATHPSVMLPLVDFLQSSHAFDEVSA